MCIAEIDNGYWQTKSMRYKFRSKIEETKESLNNFNTYRVRFEEKVKKWEGYYNSLMFKTRFELFPPIIIVSNNMDKVQAIINKCRQIDLNYTYIDIENVKNNQYTYSKT